MLTLMGLRKVAPPTADIHALAILNDMDIMAFRSRMKAMKKGWIAAKVYVSTYR